MPAVVIGNFKYYQETTNSSALEFGLFDSLARVAWSISLSYIIFACIHDSGGPINRFLSLSIYQPLSKLSFTIYLIHCLVLGATTLTFQTSPSFSEMAAYQSAISVFVISAFISIPLVLAFELPVDAIYKLTMSTKNKKSPSIPAPSKPIEQPCWNVINSMNLEIPNQYSISILLLGKQKAAKNTYISKLSNTSNLFHFSDQ